jgi:hypothetical protein
MIYYNEIINQSETYTDWVQRKHDIKYWYNAYFQIVTALHALKKYLNMHHLDLHSDNILVQRVKKGGYWKYNINDKTYYLPNLGVRFVIIDYSQSYIPNTFTSNFARKKMSKKDIKKLFQSTLDISQSPSSFKNDIANGIKTLKNDTYLNMISSIWGEMYSEKPRNSRLIESFDMNKKIRFNFSFLKK